ncbi:hypothetical protein TNCV_4389561 [Trichonephila clavipes]|nr:hypothetical protein TNCV_4389561 [Trichonephila clavipes]
MLKHKDLLSSEKEARKRSHVAAWSPSFAVTNWKGRCQTKILCRRECVKKREVHAKDNKGCIRFYSARACSCILELPLLTQSLCLIGLESVEGYPLTVNDIPKRGKF